MEVVPDTRSDANAFATVIVAIIMVNLLVIVVSILGSNTTWFQSLNKGPVNIWIILGSWIIATILSYIGLFLFYSHTLAPCAHSMWPTQKTRNLVVAMLFLISAFLSLIWVAIFFYVQNIGLSLWLVSALFIYKFWVFIYMWYLKPVAAIFLIPILAVYIYLFYAMAHLATLNNIPL